MGDIVNIASLFQIVWNTEQAAGQRKLLAGKVFKCSVPMFQDFREAHIYRESDSLSILDRLKKMNILARLLNTKEWNNGTKRSK